MLPHRECTCVACENASRYYKHIWVALLESMETLGEIAPGQFNELYMAYARALVGNVRYV